MDMPTGRLPRSISKSIACLACCALVAAAAEPISTWLVSINPSLARYAAVFDEQGLQSTDSLRALADEEIAKILRSDIRAKKPVGLWSLCPYRINISDSLVSSFSICA